MYARDKNGKNEYGDYADDYYLVEGRGKLIAIRQLFEEEGMCISVCNVQPSIEVFFHGSYQGEGPVLAYYLQTNTNSLTH